MRPSLFAFATMTPAVASLLVLLQCCCWHLAAAVIDSEEGTGDTLSRDAAGDKADDVLDLWGEFPDIGADEELPMPSNMMVAKAAAASAIRSDDAEGEALSFDEINDPRYLGDAPLATTPTAAAPREQQDNEELQQLLLLRQQHEIEMNEADEALKAQLGRASKQVHGLQMDINWLKTAVKDLDFATEGLGKL